MRGNYASPSELLQAQRETGKSYWDLIGKPLNQNTGYNFNNPHAAEEKQYNEWYDSQKLSDEDNIKLQQLLSEYDKNVKSNTDSLPKYKKGKDKFHSFAAQMGPRIYRELHKQGIYSNNTYDNMMRQLAWESNYANSLNAINNHNYAGIRKSATKYAKYKNDDQFAQEYVSLIKRKYPNAVKAKNPVQYAKALKDNGYYEDSVEHYAQSLAAMSSISNAVKAHMAANPSQYEVEVLLEDLKKQSEQPAVSTRVAKLINREPINKEPFVNTPIPTKAPLITRPEYLESNSLIKKSFEQNMDNILQGKEFQFKLPGFKKGKDSKKSLNDEQYIKIMEDVANANYERWGYPNQDAALLYVLNANDYDYRGYYNKYPPNSANSLTHWSDEFKTAYHPSFSDESKYSGHKSKYNPDGIVGGHWYNEMFVPSFDQLRKLNKLPHFRGGKDSGIKEYVSNEDMHINPDGSITTRNGNTGNVILPDVNVYAYKDYNSAFDYSGANDVMGTIADFTPVVSDVKQGLEAANDLRKGNYKEAAIGAGLLLLPNVLEKPLEVGLTGYGLLKNQKTSRGSDRKYNTKK